ncbi:MAG: helix-turn-helix domain-containing protein [Acidobacteriota bacterium]
MTSDRPTPTAVRGQLTTRARLLHAAEELFAELGIAQTSTRAIVRAAGQRNESALQYHFGGRDGLIEAMYVERGAQLADARAPLLAELEDDADVRRICEVAFLAPVLAARRDPGFVLFLHVTGQLAFEPRSRLQQVAERYVGDSVLEIRRRILPLVDLHPKILQRRAEMMHRLSAVALSQRAMSGESFDGPEGDLFVQTQVDAMAAILMSPVSPSTEKSLEVVLAKDEATADEKSSASAT